MTLNSGMLRLSDRAQIIALVTMAITMLLAGTFAFAWHERDRLLKEADALAVHQVDRLAWDLEKSLTVAEEVVHQIEGALTAPPQRPLAQFWTPEAASLRAQLLSSLPLPFELYTIGRDQRITEFVSNRITGTPHVPTADRGFQPLDQLAPGQWYVGQTAGEPLSQIIPLVWPASPNAYGVVGYGADLSFLSILARLETDRIKDGGGVALFRLSPDKTVTVLARAPFKEKELGMIVRGHVADVIASRAAGHFLTEGQFDGVERRVAFRRLTGTASDMVVVYGVPTKSVLAGWSQRMPVLVVVSLVLSSLLVLGGRRLDRSIRRQRRAEAESLSKGRTLERVFQVLQDMLFVLDREGRFLYFQSGTQDLLYLPEDEFLGKRISDVMPDHLVQLVMQRIELAFDGPLQDFDYALDLPAGTHNFNARLARLPDTDHFVVVARDVTEQQQLQQDRIRLNTFAVLLLQMATRFINLHRDGVDAAVNDGLQEMGAFTGVDRAYLCRYAEDRPAIADIHVWCATGIDPQRARQDAAMDQVSERLELHQAGESICVNDTEQLPPGWLRDLLNSRQIRSQMLLPITTSRGCWGFVGFDTLHQPHPFSHEEQTLLRLFAQVLANTYERLMAEDAVARLTAELEARVADRTQALDASVRRLEELNAQLQTFSYSVSHDLKSPLRSVEGFASLLVEEYGDQIPSDALDYLNRIRKSASHMSRLIADLLAYARLEQSEQAVQPVALRPLVMGVLEGLGNELEQCQARIAVDISADLRVQASSSGLAMVLRNLVDNAVKFARVGHAPDIRIQAQRQSNPDGRILLSVSDQGQGFDMKYHDRIFSLFQRLHRVDQIPGTGIGLAMVHKAVVRMGGRIWAESEPGQGARFHIELPATVRRD